MNFLTIIFIFFISLAVLRLTVSIVAWLYFFSDLSKIREHCSVRRDRNSGYQLLLRRKLDKETGLEIPYRWFSLNVLICILPVNFFPLSENEKRILLITQFFIQHIWLIFIVLITIIKYKFK
jgi:sensor c-di-GMP phosphodiesterase-like protein